MKKKSILADYVIEMDTLEQADWAARGRVLLSRLYENPILRQYFDSRFTPAAKVAY
jgi:hypothetical protein